MTVPLEYRRASRQFEDFLAEAAEAAGLTTLHQAYTMVEGVFTVFRRRLSVIEAAAFAQVLPPLLRALFVTGWDPAQPVVEGWDSTELAREVQLLRRHHNFAPDTAIGDVARVLRRHVDPERFEAGLARLPPPAQAYWDGAGADRPAERR